MVVDPSSRASKILDHNYTSTACHHGKHGACRLRCKFCEAYCGCQCHWPEGFEVHDIYEAVNGRVEARPERRFPLSNAAARAATDKEWGGS